MRFYVFLNGMSKTQKTLWSYQIAKTLAYTVRSEINTYSLQHKIVD